MNKNINLDIVRIFAAWMVLSVHIGQYAGINFAVGAMGVQLFFVLSGYLAFASLNRNSSVISYYKKRLVRIVPVYWSCLIIIYIKDIVLGLHSSSLADIITGQCGPKYLRYFAFLQCFTPTDNWNLWNNHGALWTMSSFVGFYILAPFLFRGGMNKFYKSMIILIAFLLGRPYLVSGIQRLFSNYPEEAHIEWFASMNPLTELYCFLFGAVLFVAIKEKKQNIYQIMVAVTLAVTALSWYEYELLFVLFIAVSVLSNPVTKKEKVCKWISMLSKGSFALYLIHPAVLELASVIWGKMGIGNRWLYVAYLYVLCIGIAYMLYYGFLSKLEKWASDKFLKDL